MLHEPTFDDVDDSPGVTTVQMDVSGDNVLHYAALPDGTASIEPVEYPEDPVLKYKFELDCFQKVAVSCVHRHESILVSAHTSAGKTVVARYAIACALANNSRVVYTSPIKALSNQKYKELRDEFGKGNVGLMTGDRTIDKDAPCLVMTTEILRMMLFTGDMLIHELSWVIYDEVHYMRDPDRGVVWEESIILLPHAVRFVFLSATIPNAREFSEWIAKIHNQVCHVVYTEYRPVPLRYYLAPLGDTKLYLVRDADSFKDQTFSVACKAASTVTVGSSFRGVDVRSTQNSTAKPPKKAVMAHTCQTVTQMINDGLYPLIVFVFSKRDCDRIHEAFGTKTFLVEEQKSLVNLIFENAIAKLDEVDRELPQIAATLALAERGIGVHHGGLMPIMKEFVEIVFQAGLIKILFATETFAMGLNMPAKTVIFHDLYKFDGSERRLINSGEFIQMSGRAGRRNEDKFGVVAVNHTGEVPPQDLRAMMTEAAQPLNSEFRVTYNMLLNLLQTTYMEPKQLMRLSFHQFQMLRELPELEKKREHAMQMVESIKLTNEQLTKSAVEIEDELRIVENRMHEIMVSESNIVPLLHPGRIVNVRNFGWSVVATGQQKKGGEIVVVASAKETMDKRIVPATSGLAKAYLIKVELRDIIELSRAALEVSFDSISNEFMRKIIVSVKTQEKKGIAVFDPVEFIKSDKDEYLKLQTDRSRLLNRKSALSEVDVEAVDKYKLKRSYMEEVEAFNRRIDLLKHLVNQKDLDAMIAVLKQLEFIDEDLQVQLKGRIASTVNAGDELVITELLLSGVFDPLTPEQCASLLSVFVSEEQGKSESEIPDGMEKVWADLLKIAKRIATISLSCGCDIDIEKFTRSFSPVFMELILSWAGGSTFAQLMQGHANYYEGSIIRTMKRLGELLAQVADAAKVAGNHALHDKFAASVKLVERGIVFTPSLYL